jgi:hypothetical protein
VAGDAKDTRESAQNIGSNPRRQRSEVVRGWSQRAHARVRLDAVAELACVDRTRVYATGFSGGGAGCTDVVLYRIAGLGHVWPSAALVTTPPVTAEAVGAGESYYQRDLVGVLRPPPITLQGQWA